MRARLVHRPFGSPPRAAYALLVALIVLVVALASGCERRSEQATASDNQPHATMRITADYGATLLLNQPVAPNQSVMRALRGITPVRLAYGGGFVAEMFDRASDAGGQRDWFLFHNGLLTPVGARQVPLAAGDIAWWDYRPWGALTSPWATVGSWPAPFTGPADAVLADPPLADALAAAGASITDRPDAPWRVRVGTNAAVAAREPAWRRALADPVGAGLSAWIADGHIMALDERGAARAVPDARALIAAVPSGTYPADGVVAVVVGLDRPAAERAASALAGHPNLGRDRYAAVLDGDGRVLTGGGQPTR